ncbi:MAG: TFIIB-type zinc ribbon-containing protein [Micrococcales bacterium]|nr:TFIIB-type zinc ribbon-containing protein [Micrococcales bacterium]MCL2667733.1 TFIIB-type zinc ribbon-containing protein [Micrococcales bacterium]
MPLPVEPQAPSPIDMSKDGAKQGVNRCPSCGSTDVELHVETSQLACRFCRHEWSEGRVEEKYGLGEGIENLVGTQIGTGAADIDRDDSTMLTMKCQGCGAEVVVDTSNAMSARCHWCRHVLSVNQQIPNGAVPDAVLPFKITHAEAVDRIRQFAGKRRTFAHSQFKKDFKPENIVGVYMPYMVIDAKASSEVYGRGEITTRRYTRGSGNNQQTYYDADVYQVSRQVDFLVDDLTIESSSERANMDVRVNTNNIINTILPFDTKNAVQWNASYLRGFTSEKRDQNVEAMRPVLENQLLSIGRAQVRPSLARFDRGVRWEQEKLDVAGTRWVSMYLPVWLYSYYHVEGGRGMVHYIAVNARTGETMGSVPVAKGKLLSVALAVGTVVEILAILIVVASAL